MEAGLWPDAEKLLRKIKMQFHRRYRKAGGALTLDRRLELAKASWDAVHDQWPPPAGTSPLESLRAYIEGTRSVREDRQQELPALSAEAQKRFDKIGEPADPTADISYVFNNIETPNADALVCPSRGAWALLGRARRDPEWFYVRIYRPTVSAIAKQKAEQQAGEPEPSKHEKRRIEDMEQLLTELKEQAGRIVCPKRGAVVQGSAA
jgi:hypothetical protein